MSTSTHTACAPHLALSPRALPPQTLHLPPAARAPAPPLDLDLGPALVARCTPDGESVPLCAALVGYSRLLGSVLECSDAVAAAGSGSGTVPVDLPASAATVRLANAAAFGTWPPEREPPDLGAYFELLDLLMFLDAYQGPLGSRIVQRAARQLSTQYASDPGAVLRALDARWGRRGASSSSQSAGAARARPPKKRKRPESPGPADPDLEEIEPGRGSNPRPRALYICRAPRP
eukprot:tig00021071_g17954.t1